MISTRQNFESWTEQGGEDTARRANQKWKKMLAEYQKPAIDPAVEEALVEYTQRRKSEIES